MIAAKLAAKLPANIVLDDLMQEGMIGLIVAVRQSKEKNEQFSAYAYQRIQGAMLDSLRAIDTASTRTRNKIGRANATIATLENRLGRRPFESEIAAEMGIQLTDYQRLLFDVYSSKLLYFDPDDQVYADVFSVIDEGANPQGRLEKRQLIDAIDWAIDGLPNINHRVITAIYMAGRSASELAAKMSLSAGRISQIRKDSLEKIRVELHRRGLIPE